MNHTRNITKEKLQGSKRGQCFSKAILMIKRGTTQVQEEKLLKASVWTTLTALSVIQHYKKDLKVLVNKNLKIMDTVFF